ncbi:MAG: FMN-binding protein [Pseudomonadota bacterium]
MNGTPALDKLPTSALAMYRSIMVIGALCALMIVTVFNATEARIARNREQALAAAVNAVLPEARVTVPVALDAAGALHTADVLPALPVFLGYDADNQLVGAAITGIGMGYQDNIRVLYAYSFERQAIIGFKVLESKETPGLGDRVETEAHFIANFEALDAQLDATGNSLANAIVPVKQGEKNNPWEVDGITGATITSFAIGNILNDSASEWVPVLEANRQVFAQAPAQEGNRGAGE